MKIYHIPITILASAYVTAPSPEEAKEIARYFEGELLTLQGTLIYEDHDNNKPPSWISPEMEIVEVDLDDLEYE